MTPFINNNLLTNALRRISTRRYAAGWNRSC